MTEIPTSSGKLYLATVIDLYSRRLLGARLPSDAEPACAAINMAVAAAAAATRSGGRKELTGRLPQRSRLDADYLQHGHLPAADDPEGAHIMSDTTDRADQPKALIVISSASQLPLAEPVGASLNIGWFLVELAAVMERFGDTHEFVLATPDGRVPTLDINGLALAMQGGKSLGLDTARTTIQQEAKKYRPEQLREKNPELVARRESELALLRRQLGRMPVTQNLPKTDSEAASIREEVVASLDDLPEKRWHSIEELIVRHRSESDDFSLADLAFMYAPGGHAPMVDFHDSPVVGELLNALRENDVPIGLICHAPVAMTSAKYRLGDDGSTFVDENHAFKGAHVTTVPKHGETGMLEVGYPKIPGEKTRLPYYVDVALEDAGYDVDLTLNPTAVKIVWDEEHGLPHRQWPAGCRCSSRKARRDRRGQVWKERQSR